MIGAIYAVFGGLKAVVVSDAINGIGLLIIGILVPTLGLIMLGDGSFLAGLTTIATTNTEKLNAIGSASDPVPFGTIFTGMILANLFYWGTNQYVIQRTLGAASLAEGQKGVLLSGYFKLLVPFMMMVPGLIAFHLYGPVGGAVPQMDLAYPQLVKDVLPIYLSGFFLAVLLGAVFSSFNSLLNSAATLFVLDVYQPLIKSEMSDAQLIKIAKIASVVIALFSFIAAPMLQYAEEGLWQIIRVFTGFYNIPVIAIVLVGLFTTHVPAIGAKVAVIFHVIAYGLVKFLLDIDIHFIHLYAVLFFIEVSIMLFFGAIQPKQSGVHFIHKPQVDLTPWRYGWAVSSTMFAGIVALYLLFSPIGLVGGLSSMFWFTLGLLVFVNIAICIVSVKRYDAMRVTKKTYERP